MAVTTGITVTAIINNAQMQSTLVVTTSNMVTGILQTVSDIMATTVVITISVEMVEATTKETETTMDSTVTGEGINTRTVLQTMVSVPVIIVTQEVTETRTATMGIVTGRTKTIVLGRVETKICHVIIKVITTKPATIIEPINHQATHEIMAAISKITTIIETSIHQRSNN